MFDFSAYMFVFLEKNELHGLQNSLIFTFKTHVFVVWCILPASITINEFLVIT
jgi:hypothetical protein